MHKVIADFVLKSTTEKISAIRMTRVRGDLHAKQGVFVFYSIRCNTLDTLTLKEKRISKKP